MEEWAEKNIIHSCTFPNCKYLFHTSSELKVIYLEPLTFLEDLTPNHTVEGQLTRYLLVCSESSFCQLGSSTKCRGKINHTAKSQYNEAFGNNDFPFHPRGKYCEVPAAIGGSCWSSGNITLRTLHYTDWFREILILAYYNPYMGGLYNPLYKTTKQGLEHCSPGLCSAHIPGSQTCCPLSIALLFGFFEDLKTNDFREKGMFLWSTLVMSPRTNSLLKRSHSWALTEYVPTLGRLGQISLQLKVVQVNRATCDIKSIGVTWT